MLTCRIYALGRHSVTRFHDCDTAYWVIPNSVKEVPYAPIMDINFFGKSHSINRVTPTSTPSSSRSSSPTPPSSSTASTPRSLQPPLDEELEDFYKALASNSTKPAILSIIEPYSSNYVTMSLNEDLPMCLLDLMKPENLTKEYGELLTLSKQCSITVTPAHIKTVENKTRCQSKCNLWHRMSIQFQNHLPYKSSFTVHKSHYDNMPSRAQEIYHFLGVRT